MVGDGAGLEQGLGMRGCYLERRFDRSGNPSDERMMRQNGDTAEVA